jgi:hypothetical protein
VHFISLFYWKKKADGAFQKWSKLNGFSKMDRRILQARDQSRRLVMEGSKYPEWRKAYHEALLEVDPHKLTERIRAAETLIASRLGELRIGPQNPKEQQALLDACNALSVIQREN